MRLRSATLLALLLLLAAAPAAAQLVPSPRIGLDAAQRVAAAARAEAERNGWEVAIAIVDPSGEPVLFHRLDGVQPASLDIALAKARTAARFRRPTRALADAVAAGRLALLGVEDLVPLAGGLPVEVDEQVVGGIGVSGVTSDQDEQIAAAGLRALAR